MRKKDIVEPRFAVCLDNENYPASLEIGKLYQVVPDDDAAAHGYIRVIDESGEDYAYSTERFFVLPVPQVVEEALLAAA